VRETHGEREEQPMSGEVEKPACPKNCERSSWQIQGESQ